MKKIITPLNFIIAGLILIMLSQFGIFNKIPLAAVDLTDPQTNATFSCNSTYSCYQQVSGQITGADRGPALACLNNKCVVQSCNEGEEITQSCPGGTHITVSRCTSGQIVYTNEICPLPECTSDKQCTSAADTNCDGQLDPVFNQCVSNKCQVASASRCTDSELFWNQYKWYIISGGLLLLGIGGLIFGSKIASKI